MNKKLFTQIKNEWRSNLWLVTELLLVSVVLWYIVDYMYVQTSIYNEPRGFDISHCYLVQMGRLTDKSPDFIPNQTDEEKRQDIKELLSRLQHRPDIEAAGLGQNSYPYVMGIILRHGTVTAWWLLCRKNGMIWARSFVYA